MKEEKFLIVGAGRSGIAAGKMLLSLGKEIVIYDGNTDLDTEAVKAQIGTTEDILFILGKVQENDFSGIDKCVVSPGVALDTPVMKNTNALLALTNDEIREKEQTACIRCGACVNHCPLSLNPQAYLKAYRANKLEELERLRVDICMECGCCSYICPTAQPLVETNKLAKALLRKKRENEKKKEEKKDVK